MEFMGTGNFETELRTLPRISPPGKASEDGERGGLPMASTISTWRVNSAQQSPHRGKLRKTCPDPGRTRAFMDMHALIPVCPAQVFGRILG